MVVSERPSESWPELSENVRLGPGHRIDTGVVLGYEPGRAIDDYTLIIGPGARVRSGTVIHAGTTIGAGLETGHNVLIREQNTIGDDFSMWSNSVVDYGCTIGSGVKAHCNVYIAQFTVIEDEVFLGPGVAIANDLHPGCPFSKECMRGPVIKKGAQIGLNSTLLPFITVGEHAVVGAGSVVTRDVPAYSVVCGNPARVVKDVREVRCARGYVDRPYAIGESGA
jgi:acetyltransferase-like isoleucine patch superfamily enzyme